MSTAPIHASWGRAHFTSTNLYNAAHVVGHTHTHPFNVPLSGTTRVSRYKKAKTNLDFTEARDSEWQWHQLDHMQVCTSLQTDNHASTSPLSFLQAGCPSCRPTNSVKALKAFSANTQRLFPALHAGARFSESCLHYSGRDRTFAPPPDITLYRKKILSCTSILVWVRV